MTKELFIQTLMYVESQHRLDEDCAKAFQRILPHDFISGYDNGLLYKQIIRLLSIDNPQAEDWIEYWMYELDFGKKWKPGTVTQDGKNVRLKTANDLWNLLRLPSHSK